MERNREAFSPSPEFKTFREGDIIENVVFRVERGRVGQDIFRSSERGRKLIVTHSVSERPIEGTPYQVQVLEDTNPDDPTRGKLMVKLVAYEAQEETGGKTTLDEPETRAVLAELAARPGREASRVLYKQTHIPKSERVGLGTDEIIARAKESGPELEPSERLVEAALDREMNADLETDELLGPEGSNVREVVEERAGQVREALKKNRELEIRRDGLLAEEAHLLAEIEDAASMAVFDALEDVRRELEMVGEEQRQLEVSSPEAYYALKLQRLKEYRRDLTEGRIVETAYVREQAEDVVSHLRAHQPVLLYGHLGSGKTEFAMHVARKYLGKDALIISGSKHLSLAEFYGHQVLAIDDMGSGDIEEYSREVEARYRKWLEENNPRFVSMDVEERETEKKLAHDRILQTYLTQFKGGTISKFFLGPIYRAMAEGRPIIIDEANAIPHEILISLNHILTRRAGEQVNVQQDSGAQVTIKEGFGVLMTGNLNQGQETYVQRQEMDPAFLSRLYKKEYDYLPQMKEGALTADADAKSELYQVMLARLMDRNGNLNIPEGSERKLWNLAKAARVTQDVFAGRQVDSAFYLRDAGGRATQYFLQESVLSMRALEKILSQWQREGYRYELDFYVWREFVGESTSNADTAYLYQLFHDQFGFFSSDGWDRPSDSGGRKSAAVNIPKNKAAKPSHFPPRAVVDVAFGRRKVKTA